MKILWGNELAARLAAASRRGKLASRMASGHKRRMRILIAAALLFVAACAPRPAVTPTPEPAAAEPAPAATDGHDHRTLNGMTAGELIEHFGKPRLQVREGEGTKIQFAGPNCMLDFYLYPGQGGVPRVSHIDARNLQGADVNAQSCVYAIESARGVR
ncbi:MAG TPA: hypothetical protein VFO12_10295 [Sphingomicrobium sp.]|nr:hypothetical protein [Sphingomicrobium sp.]